MESTVSPSFLSSMKLLSIPSTPASKSFLKMFKSTGPRTKPYRTPLVPGRQSYVTPFTVTFYAPPVSQLLTHCMRYHQVFLSVCVSIFINTLPDKMIVLRAKQVFPLKTSVISCNLFSNFHSEDNRKRSDMSHLKVF